MQGIQKHKRVKLIGPVDVWHNQSDLPEEAYMLNMSYGGMALQSRKPFKGPVEVMIYFANGKGERVGETLMGQVIWCKPYDTLYRAGIEFGRLNQKDHPMTLRALRAFTGPADVQPV